ncbi:MAG: DUF411 domain-containing protein [Burkholderiales bacterium]|nr:DUF411 domain-containing protein [Burkholderiales bacterium]
MTPGRRDFIAAALAALAVSVPIGATAAPVPMEVWKAPTCGCCKDWIRHLESNGFKVTVHDSGNTAARSRLGIPKRLGSCHTALVEGYAIEGHVPAREIRRLLAERPNAIGLAVPGMPIGSPGMDGPEYGARKDPYDVLLLRKDGSTPSYRNYP